MTALLDTLLQDIRYALRQLRGSPGFAAVAILSLAIGIGANLTIFSAANALLRREVNATRPEELVRVYRGEHSGLPWDWFLSVARNSRTLSGVVSEDVFALGVEVGDARERVRAASTSSNFFSELGVGAALGALYSGEAGAEVGPVIVLSHRYWVSRLGADPGVVGRVLRLNGNPYTVIGVAREGFTSSQYLWAPALFVPATELPRLRGASPEEITSASTYVTGRLAPGATPAQVEAELRSLAASFPRADSLATRAGAFSVAPARGITAEARGPMTIAAAFLQVVVALVLLIACANLGNLLLARGVARRREFAVRTALGVSRSRLVRQLLTESTLLAVLGGAAGLAVAFYLTAALPRLIPEGIGFALDIAPDGAVLAFATVLALLTGTLFGVAPALQASRADIRTMLSGDGVASRRSRLRSAFLGGQVALAMALLVVSALFIRGLEAARAIDPGFDSTRVLDLEVDLGLRNYDVARGRVFQEQILERIRALADVEEATIISTPPLVQANSGTAVMPATAAPDDRSAMRGTTFTEVAPGYLEFARIPLVAGRALETRDADGAPAVAVVNESFARMLFDGTDVAGRSFRIAGSDALTTIVGVVRDTKYKSLNDRDEPFMYLPIGQRYDGAFSLQVRVRQDTPAAREAIRAAVLELDGALPLGAVRAATERMAVSLLPARLGAALVGTFGTLALLLAAVGVYGVTAYLVGRRTVEIGVRVALGATGPSVLRLLMGETLRVVGIGAAVGVAIGVGIGSAASSQLHGVGALDPIALTSAFATLVAVAALGTWWPSRRALRGDPMSALRAE